MCIASPRGDKDIDKDWTVTALGSRSCLSSSTAKVIDLANKSTTRIGRGVFHMIYFNICHGFSCFFGGAFFRYQKQPPDSPPPKLRRPGERSPSFELPEPSCNWDAEPNCCCLLMDIHGRTFFGGLKLSKIHKQKIHTDFGANHIFGSWPNFFFSRFFQIVMPAIQACTRTCQMLDSSKAISIIQNQRHFDRCFGLRLWSLLQHRGIS